MVVDVVTLSLHRPPHLRHSTFTKPSCNSKVRLPYLIGPRATVEVRVRGCMITSHKGFFTAPALTAHRHPIHFHIGILIRQHPSISYRLNTILLTTSAGVTHRLLVRIFNHILSWLTLEFRSTSVEELIEDLMYYNPRRHRRGSQLALLTFEIYQVLCAQPQKR